MPSSPEFSFAAMADGSERQRSAPKAAEKPAEARGTAPVIEDENSVSYLGVRLDKAHTSSDFVPDRQKYADFIEDRFALELEQKIAVGFASGDPTLIEGGTSIGKTTTVRKMCADLGWEVHYANLNGATDVEDLMGRYIPNPHRTKPDDPEFIFADGKVTAGLRQEEGKIKVIILDEFNAAAPNIVIRLHEVNDAMERNGEVVLSEDASEAVPVSKSKTKIIALTNPPGKGYFGREPLDPAQLRRWVYLKEASDLPEGTFSFSTKSLFGLESATEEVPKEIYLATSPEVMTLDQLAEIPGIKEIEPLYEEFHRAAKKMLGIGAPGEKLDRKIAADQPQPFIFDDRMEPRRVRDFVARFYNGDLTETFQNALRYYYSNKLESAQDRQKLEELIRGVAYIPQADSRRVGLEAGAETEKSGLSAQVEQQIAGILDDPTVPDSIKDALRVGGELKLSDEVAEQIEQAKKLMGQDFLGPEEVKRAFGFEIDAKKVPEIPFKATELAEALKLGQMLVLRVDETADGQQMTMETMQKILSGKTKDGGKMLYNSEWQKDETFFKDEAVRPGWALVTKETVPDSENKDYLDQTEVLVDYLKTKVFAGKRLPKEYQDAITQFESEKTRIRSLLDGGEWQEAAEELEKLRITQLTRQTPAEATYDLITTLENNDERLLPEMYTWTSRRSSGGSLVNVGYFKSDGVRVSCDYPDYRGGNLGVSFSRSQ